MWHLLGILLFSLSAFGGQGFHIHPTSGTNCISPAFAGATGNGLSYAGTQLNVLNQLNNGNVRHMQVVNSCSPNLAFTFTTQPITPNYATTQMQWYVGSGTPNAPVVQTFQYLGGGPYVWLRTDSGSSTTQAVPCTTGDVLINFW